MDSIISSENYLWARKLLDGAAARHQAIASNLANLETPGYKRVDLTPDFEKQLAAMARQGRWDSVRHLKAEVMVDTAAQPLRPDGSTVEPERELMEMNRNALNYEFLTHYVSDSIRQLKMAATGRPQA